MFKRCDSVAIVNHYHSSLNGKTGVVCRVEGGRALVLLDGQQTAAWYTFECLVPQEVAD